MYWMSSSRFRCFSIQDIGLGSRSETPMLKINSASEPEANATKPGFILLAVLQHSYLLTPIKITLVFFK